MNKNEPKKNRRRKKPAHALIKQWARQAQKACDSLDTQPQPQKADVTS